MIRRLYDWVLSWAGHRWSRPALFALAFAEASVFPIPPDVLLIALALGERRRALQAAAICLAGSVLGGLFGYLIGWQFWTLAGERIVAFYHGEAVMAQVADWAGQYGFWGVFAAALTPIPYKIFTISAGVLSFSLPVFIGASVLGRGLRFFIVAGLIQRYGGAITGFIDRWFNWVALAFTVLLIGGFWLLTLL
jgi:membrane protein YqaA with SNARE-associated domain